MNDLNEYVSVLVPKRHLTRVYAFLGAIDEQSPTPETRIEHSSDDSAVWTPELIERQFRESSPFMMRFEKYLAEHAGKEFSTRDMADALEAERGWNTVAGALGAYGRRVKNRYKQTTWPFEARWDYVSGLAYHSMSEEVAEIIRSL
jgi:hypothetical protein